MDHCSTGDDVVVLGTGVDECMDRCSTGDDLVVLGTGLEGVGRSSRKGSGVDEYIDR